MRSVHGGGREAEAKPGKVELEERGNQMAREPIEMGRNEAGRPCFSVQNADGSTDWYDQAEEVKDPPVQHAEFYWHWCEGAKGHEIAYSDDKRPDSLIIRDGGNEGHHKYHRRTAG